MQCTSNTVITVGTRVIAHIVCQYTTLREWLHRPRSTTLTLCVSTHHLISWMSTHDVMMVTSLVTRLTMSWWSVTTLGMDTLDVRAMHYNTRVYPMCITIHDVVLTQRVCVYTWVGLLTHLGWSTKPWIVTHRSWPHDVMVWPPDVSDDEWW